MSNVKQVDIQVTVPFYWLSSHNGIEEGERAFVAGCFLDPSGGLELEYADEGYVPNHDGSDGKTSVYRAFVSGQEATSYPALERLVQAMASATGAKVHVARAMDMQWPDEEHRWEDLDWKVEEVTV